jgi:hypothetical protein
MGDKVWRLGSTVKRLRSDGRYNWRDVTDLGVERPTAWQVRAGGPPLLFATDMRMSILVTLAAAGGMIRRYRLMQCTRSGKCNTALETLIEHGLVARLRLSRSEVLLGLDAAHPVSVPLRDLLLRIAERYGFEKPMCDPNELEGGESPRRLSRRRDARYTFGDPERTLTLLAVYVLGEVRMKQLVCILGRFSEKSVRGTLWRFRSFGVLKATGTAGGTKGIAFSLDCEYAFAGEIRSILESLATALPHWTLAIRKAATSGRPVLRSKRRQTINQKDAMLNRWTKS